MKISGLVKGNLRELSYQANVMFAKTESWQYLSYRSALAVM